MDTQHVDIIVVGAGLSGIGAGYHIQTKCPDKHYVILEGRETMGGTWDLFRYPGVRSDSDMFTLGYSFRPWDSKKVISEGDAILDYIKTTAAEFGIDQHIRYQHRVCGASWSSETAQWTIDVEVGAEKTPRRYTCDFFYTCTGYYEYDYGYTPKWDGFEEFEGEIVHPQQWSDDINYDGKRVIVIGSGATAVTLVPAMAQKAAHVTMLQRSPTYIVSRPSESVMAKAFYRLFPRKLAHGLSRWQSILLQMYQYVMARTFPATVKKSLVDMVREELNGAVDVDTHFTPDYNVWDQRVCLVPDSDFFKAMNEGRVSVVTDHIERFTADGIALKSGEILEADMIVTATGLRMRLLSGIKLRVDGAEIQTGETFTYKGLMISNVPNFAHSIGYTNASWTLKSELISEYVCRLINYMDDKRYDYCVPVYELDVDSGKPIVDFTSGYIQRALPHLPKQGEDRPWFAHQNYVRDVMDIRFGNLEDGVLKFRQKAKQATQQATSSA